MYKVITTILLFAVLSTTMLAQDAPAKKEKKKRLFKKSQKAKEVVKPVEVPEMPDTPKASQTPKTPKTPVKPEVKTPTVVKDMKAPAEEVEVDKDAPVFEFMEESFDFGSDIIDGEKKTHTFEFTNTGNSPLIIEKVKASCGCTTPNWPKTPIAPGATGEITATYNSKGRPGKFNKAIRVTSNAATPTKVLYIKGEVQKANPQEGLPVKKKSIVEESN